MKSTIVLSTLQLCFLIMFVHIGHPAPAVRRSILSAEQLVCPDQCRCDVSNKTLHCSGVTTAHQWRRLLETVPASTSRLHLHDCKITTAIVDILHRSSPVLGIDFLEFDHCEMSSVVSEMFVPFSSVHHLSVHDCTLLESQEIADSPFSSMARLQTLHLTADSLTDVRSDAFHGLGELHLINLTNNRLSRLPSDIFATVVSSLHTVDLSHNRLEYIHPNILQNATSLKTLKLSSNRLQGLYESTIANLSELQTVELHDNPWLCSCGLQWLNRALNVVSHAAMFYQADLLICNGPEQVAHSPIRSVDPAHFVCVPPSMVLMPSSQTILFMRNAVLTCNASGSPPPSVYWLTPHGILAHRYNRRWMTAPKAAAIFKYNARPTFFVASLEASDAGNLQLNQFRAYFVGEYTCVAENPAGLVTYSVNVTVAVNISEHTLFSIIFGLASAGVFLAAAILFGAIRMLVEKMCCRRSKLSPELERALREGEDFINHAVDMQCSEDGRSSPDYSSPQHCVTPITGNMLENGDVESSGAADHIRETLEDVRQRLKLSVNRIRTQAYMIRARNSTAIHNIRESSSRIRESSSRYMQTLRDNSSVYARNLRASSSQYAVRMRAGVVQGVEQVKQHVMSIKEFCGTGDLNSTVSAATVCSSVDICDENVAIIEPTTTNEASDRR